MATLFCEWRTVASCIVDNAVHAFSERIGLRHHVTDGNWAESGIGLLEDNGWFFSLLHPLKMFCPFDLSTFPLVFSSVVAIIRYHRIHFWFAQLDVNSRTLRKMEQDTCTVCLLILETLRESTMSGSQGTNCACPFKTM